MWKLLIYMDIISVGNFRQSACYVLEFNTREAASYAADWFKDRGCHAIAVKDVRPFNASDC